MKLKGIVLLLIGSLLLSALTGCGSGSEEIILSTEKSTKETEKEETSTAKKETRKETEKAVSEETEAETTVFPETSAAETSEEETTKEAVDLSVYHPVVRICSDGPVTSKEEYVNCTVSVEGTADAYLLNSVSAKIRVRGNATAEMNPDNPPFKIKFDKKSNLAGLHNGEKFKTWVLLNSSEGIITSHLIYQMGKKVYGEDYYVTDTTLVKVYLNDQYLGIYTAAEQNQIKKNRINVKEAVTGREAGNRIGYFFEMNNYPEEDEYNFVIDVKSSVITDMNGTSDNIGNKTYTLKNDIVSEKQLDFISGYMNNMFQLIHAATYDGIAYKFNRDYQLVKANTTPEEAIRNVIDVDSAVAIYIMEEITGNRDRGNGSFFFAVDFSSGSRYSKLTFTPPWDLGYRKKEKTEGYTAAIYAEKDSYYATDNPWLIMLMYNEWFREAVAERVQELKDSGEIDQLFADLSVYINSFSAEVPNEWYIDESQKRITYYTQRYNWLKSEFCR